MDRQHVADLYRRMYRIELRNSPDDRVWWLCIGSRVESKHTSKRAAQRALTRIINDRLAIALSADDRS